MTLVLAVCVGVLFAVSVYLLLGRELKGVAMGVFLIGHAANLSILAMSGPPVAEPGALPKRPPLLTSHEPAPNQLDTIVDPLPQALILTAIVIGFAVMGFLLTLLVKTSQTTGTLSLGQLALEPQDDEDDHVPPPASQTRQAHTPAEGDA